MSAQPAGPDSGTIAFNGITAWGIASVIGIIAGSIGPWVSVGFYTVGGTDGDGVITLVIGAIAGVLVLTKKWTIAALVLGIAAAAVAIYDIASISDTSTELISASPGWGIIAVAVAAVSLVVWAGYTKRTHAQSAGAPANIGA